MFRVWLRVGGGVECCVSSHDALTATVPRRHLRHVPRHLLHRRHLHRLRAAHETRQQVARAGRQLAAWRSGSVFRRRVNQLTPRRAPLGSISTLH